MVDRTLRRKRSWHLWLMFGVCALALALLSAEVLHLRWLSFETQLDLSTGRTRQVTKVLGATFPGEERNTFVSSQLGGQSLQQEADWQVLGENWNLFLGSHSHSRLERFLYAAESYLPAYWDEGGFDEEAKVESARRFLIAARSGEEGLPNFDFMLMIQRHVERMADTPRELRRTTVADLPAPAAIMERGDRSRQ
jgi:hypothetical protein